MAKRLGGLYLFAATLLALSTLPAQAESILRVAILGEPDTLDPQTSGTTYAADIDRQMFTALTLIGPDGKLGPGAAKSWTISPDGMTYRFTLRPDLTWSDGSKMSADDWVYSLRRQLDPKTLAESSTLLYEIENAHEVNLGKLPLEDLGVRAIDPETLEIKLQVPDPSFLQFTAVVLPVDQAAIKAHGKDWVKPENWVSNGPYVLAANIPHTSIELKRNTHYPADLAAHYDKVAVSIVTDQSQSLQRYRAGDFDLVADIWSNEYNRMPADRIAERHSFPAGTVMFLSFNARRAPLDDIRVREALSLAVDRDVITSKIIGAGSTPAVTLMPGGWVGLSRQFPPPEQLQPIAARRALAKSLLHEAGYSETKRPSVEIIYAGDTRQRVAVLLQAMWREIGVDAKLRQSEVTAMYSSLNAGDYEVGLPELGNTLIHDPIYYLRTFEKGGYFDFNRAPLPAFDSAVAAASQEADPAKRAEFEARAEGALLDNWDIAPLYFEPLRYLISPAVAGWQPGAAPRSWRYLMPRTAAAR